MDILSIKIENFLAIGVTPPIRLQDQGLVLVQGVNEDDTSATSNGVGKSSIVDGLCWAIYGETARGVSGDAVVNKVAKKNCMVQVFLQDGATTYFISRHRKHKDFKNQTLVKACSSGSDWIDISKGTEKETQELIDGIMGCSLDVFMAAIYAGQEVTPDLPKMTDKQLKLLLEEAAGVQRLEGAYEIAREKMNEAQKVATRAWNEVQTLETQIEGNRLDLANAQVNLAVFEDGREGRAKAEDDVAQTHKKVAVALLTEMKGIDTDALNKRNSELGRQLAGHSDMLRKCDELKRTANSAQRALDSARIRLENATRAAKDLKFSFDNAEEEIKKPCPHCAKPGDEHDLESYKAHVKTRLTAALAEVKELRTSHDAAVAANHAAVQAVNLFEKTIPDVSELSKEQTQINAELRKHADLKFRAGNEKLQMDRRAANAKSIREEANPHAATVELLTKKDKDLVEKHAAAVVKRSQADARFDVLRNVASVFSPAGVRAHILDTVTPFLNSRTADYLSALSDGNISAIWTTLATTAKGELKEKFCIEVANDKGAESFAGLSGGEKRKVRLSTMLALQDLVSSRATKPINLWMGDEIDDALDSAGLERLMGILERKARERGTVLVISHNELNSWIDQVVTVTKREGVSTVSGVLVE